MKHLLPAILVCIVFLSGCASLDAPERSDIDLVFPENWFRSNEIFDNEKAESLNFYIAKALSNNHSLKQRFYDLKLAEQNVTIAHSSLLPEVTASFDIGRREMETSEYVDTHETSVNISYELDLWGKLDAAEQRDLLAFEAAQAQFEDHKQLLIASVAKAWINVIEAKKVLALYESRTQMAQERIAIVDRGHQLGISQALDVYLTQNEYQSEQTVLLNQKSVVLASIRKLERLIGAYPSGRLSLNNKIPLWDEGIEQSLPSELLYNKPSLRVTWLNLLSQNAHLAYVHKQRFPSIEFSASLINSSTDFDNAFTPSRFVWSMLGSLSAPIFNAGKLKANEEKAKIGLKQIEQQYIDEVYEAFELAENTLTKDINLKASLNAALQAEEKAVVAEELSFQEYRKGLRDYSTVLIAQQRARQAQIVSIELKKQLAANRIDLFLAFGGEQLSTFLESNHE